MYIFTYEFKITTTTTVIIQFDTQSDRVSVMTINRDQKKGHNKKQTKYKTEVQTENNKPKK